MKKNSFNFKKKIECIYTKIAKKNIRTLAQLFLANNKTSLENRALHIRNKWLKKEDFVPRLFKKEFKAYPFAKLQIDTTNLFKDANEFLELSLEEFCKRIELYLYKEQGFNFDEEIGYKYLYIYSPPSYEKSFSLDYYLIEYEGLEALNSINIKVSLPTSKKSLAYKGKLLLEKNRLILDIKNSKNHIYALFNPDLENDNIGYLVGVLVGISNFNQKTPIAKKVILSKTKIENLQELYLILNETETINATENISFLNTLSGVEKEDTQLRKIYHKISNINSFLKNASSNFYQSFYKQLAFKEFDRIDEVFSNLINNKAYYIAFREDVLKVLLESFEYEKYDSLYIVMPIYTKYGTFNHYSKTIDFIKNRFLELSQKIELEFIFTLNRWDYDISHVKNYLDKLSQNAKIYFALNKNIEDKVDSRDFICSRNKSFVITKELRSLKAAHKFYLSELSHQEHENFYKKIKNFSIEYKEFIQNPKLVEFEEVDQITQKLLGTWYLYLYGTNNKFWNFEIVFKKDKTVETYLDGILQNSGTIIHKNIQSVIISDNIYTQRTTVATFDNNLHSLNKAFLVSIVSKAIYGEEDIYSIAICSREKFKQDDIDAILLNKNREPLRNYGEIKKRLFNYLVNRL